MNGNRRYALVLNASFMTHPALAASAPERDIVRGGGRRGRGVRGGGRGKEPGASRESPGGPGASGRAGSVSDRRRPSGRSRSRLAKPPETLSRPGRGTVPAGPDGERLAGVRLAGLFRASVAAVELVGRPTPRHGV